MKAAGRALRDPRSTEGDRCARAARGAVKQRDRPDKQSKDQPKRAQKED